MKAIALWIFLLPAAAAQAAGGEEMLARTRSASVGRLAPAATLETLDGKRIELGELYGRQPVYLKFWATWCVPCRQQMPHFEAAWQRYHASVAVLAVNLGLNDDVADVREYLDKTQLSMPVAIDSAGDLATAFGVVVTPMHVLIDAAGRVAYVGHEAGADLDRALDALSRSKPEAQPASGRTQVVSRVRAGVGDKAPAFREFTPGKTGKPAVLAFFIPWCESYLKESRPEVATSCTKTREVLAQAYRVQSTQASWLAVASRVWVTEADVQAYRKKFQIEHPVAFDSTGEIFREYGVKEVPTVLIVEADGTIRRRFDGFSPDLAGALASLNPPAGASGDEDPRRAGDDGATGQHYIERPPRGGPIRRLHLFYMSRQGGGRPGECRRCAAHSRSPWEPRWSSRGVANSRYRSFTYWKRRKR